MRRFCAASVLALLLLPAGATAWATTLPAAAGRASAVAQETVAGPARIDIVLRDAYGKPVGNVLVQLVMSVTFVGRIRDAVLDQVRTDWQGRATLTFSPSERGTFRTRVRFLGAPGYAPSETFIAFTVQDPVSAPRLEPVGIGGKFARSGLILVPLAGIWGTYAFVASLAMRIQRAKDLAVPTEPAVIDLVPLNVPVGPGRSRAGVSSPSPANGDHRRADHGTPALPRKNGGRRR